MVSNIKNILNKQSIIQLTLFKVILIIFTFLIIFIFVYGHNFWEKQVLKYNYTLLLSASNAQSKIQSQISSIEELKQDKILTNNQKILRIEGIIKSIINQYHDNPVGYYDIDLDLIVKNQNETDSSFNEIRSTMGLSNEFNDLSKNKVISVNLPLYDKEKLVGYVWAYAKNSDYVFLSFYNLSEIIILILSLIRLNNVSN